MNIDIKHMVHIIKSGKCSHQISDDALKGWSLIGEIRCNNKLWHKDEHTHRREDGCLLAWWVR